MSQCMDPYDIHIKNGDTIFKTRSEVLRDEE